MSTLRQQLGQLFKQVRKEKGLTQKELGEQLGLTEITIRRYEIGSQNLTLDTIEKIADLLGIELQISRKQI